MAGACADSVLAEAAGGVSIVFFFIVISVIFVVLLLFLLFLLWLCSKENLCGHGRIREF
jgi:hypothetical protein